MVVSTILSSQHRGAITDISYRHETTLQFNFHRCMKPKSAFELLYNEPVYEVCIDLDAGIADILCCAFNFLLCIYSLFYILVAGELG